MRAVILTEIELASLLDRLARVKHRTVKKRDRRVYRRAHLDWNRDAGDHRWIWWVVEESRPWNIAYSVAVGGQRMLGLIMNGGG